MRFRVAFVIVGLLCAVTALGVDLQSMLDRGGEVTFPAGDYEISKTLVIRGGTHLTCEPGFRARLADGANCAILANRLRGDGNETGGQGLVRESG